MNPALLGFDDDIHQFCGGSSQQCDGTGNNVLMLFDNQVKYNTCRNFEWQVCAAKGLLRRQGGKAIRFARAPKTLDLASSRRPFGKCSGWTDRSCDSRTGYANDDIYYLEACLFSMICGNRAHLFTISEGDAFFCDFDQAGFETLADLLMTAPDRLTPALDEGTGYVGACPNEVYHQCGGTGYLGITCCPANSNCEEGNSAWYKQCIPGELILY